MITRILEYNEGFVCRIAMSTICKFKLINMKHILTDFSVSLSCMRGVLGVADGDNSVPYSSSKNCRHEWMSRPLTLDDLSLVSGGVATLPGGG